MLSQSISTLGVLLSTMAVLQPPPVPHPIEVRSEQWRPQTGDLLLIDTRENNGYLIHSDGSYLTFPVITGQRRTVRYIGRTYYAATPNRHWTVESMDIKGDNITFGPTGRFLRLYRDGEESPYGLHEHASETVMFGREDRYQSMGCVILESVMLNIVEQTYELNGQHLDVFTRDGITGKPAENLAS